MGKKNILVLPKESKMRNKKIFISVFNFMKCFHLWNHSQIKPHFHVLDEVQISCFLNSINLLWFQTMIHKMIHDLDVLNILHEIHSYFDFLITSETFRKRSPSEYNLKQLQRLIIVLIKDICQRRPIQTFIDDIFREHPLDPAQYPISKEDIVLQTEYEQSLDWDL